MQLGIVRTEASKASKAGLLIENVKRNYDLYLLILPTLIYVIIFLYVPMYGLQIAFKDFIAVKGFWGSPWVGFEHFERFFRAFNFWQIFNNTLSISLYSLVVGFPCPIILAIMLNEVRHKHYKKTIQMVTYAPYFISNVVMVGIMVCFLSTRMGIVNQLIRLLGGEPVSFMTRPELFQTIYVLTGVWQSVGFSAIIYIAVLSGIDPQLHEAAIMDGASKLKRIRHIDIPGIIPTAIILLILSLGNIMNVGFEKILLMQNKLNLSASEVISTYTYSVGLIGGEFGFSTAVGLFNSVINFILLVLVNQLAKHLGETSLW